MTVPLIVREDDGSLWLSITEAQAEALKSGQAMVLEMPYTPPPGAIILTTEQWNEWSRNGASRISGVHAPWEPEPDQSANLQTEALRHGRDKAGICTECGVPASTMHVDGCSFAAVTLACKKLYAPGFLESLLAKSDLVTGNGVNNQTHELHATEPACACPSSVIARGEHEPACAWKAAQ